MAASAAGAYLARTYPSAWSWARAVVVFRDERHEHVGRGGVGAAALVLEARRR